MKAYFNIIDFFGNMWNPYGYTLKLKSYKIDGVETLTNEFFTDTQNVITTGGVNGDLFYCTVENDGSNPQPFDEIWNANTFNPFVKAFKMEYPIVNGFPRGLPTGQENGLTNYGEGVMKFGVDKPIILHGSILGYGSEIGDIVFTDGCFFLDIDFTKNLNVEFEVVLSLDENGSPYEKPYVFQRFNIDFDVLKCQKSYKVTYPNNDLEANGTNVLDLVDFGFLAGITRDEYVEGISPFVEITCSGPSNSCEDKEVTKSHALFFIVPDQQEDPDEVFKECCYQHIVLADLSNSDDIRNDYSSVFHQKQLPNETCDFILYNFQNSTEYPLNDSTYGQFYDFGTFANNLNLSGFKVEWRKVLQLLGSGGYRIIKRISVAGMNYDVNSVTFTLKPYTTKNADKTIRMDVVMNGKLIHPNIEFKGSNWKQSIRVPGFFGRREPKFEEDILVRRNYDKKQISMKQNNEYKFQTNLIPYCITDEIFDFMLYANEIFITDYNLNNHSYNFVKKNVRLSNNDGTTYGVKTRKAKLNLTFTDGKGDNLKRNFI